MTFQKFIKLSFLSFVIFFFLGCVKLSRLIETGQPSQKFNLLIRNGKIVDGTGNAWFYDDVGIKNGKIARIGNLTGYKSRNEINAKGLIVSPGFIDVHTHIDSSLLKHPYAENYIRDGVTTIVAGNCGGSVLDVTKHFKSLKKKGAAINVATLIGHNTVLHKIKGDIAGELTPEQMEECKKLLRKAMYEGAVGMSTGLIYSPGKYSSIKEIIEFQKVVAELGGIYASHMRNESTRILEAIDETLKIGKEANSRIEISHFKLPGDNTIGGSKTILQKVLDARAQGQEVWLDQYPYTASSTGISMLFPDWLFEKGSSEAKKILSDPNGLKRVLVDMKKQHEEERHREDFSFAVITSSKAYPEFVGESIKEVTQILKLKKEKGESVDWKNISPLELPEVSMEEQYLTIVDIYLKGGASCVYHTQSEEDVVNIMQCPLVAICSDGGLQEPGEGKPHPRSYGSNARVLGRYVREKKVLTIEDAIRKMTSLPALAFRFKDRGVLREGYWADITIFNPDTIIDKATFENPHQYSEEIEYVIVNGEIVFANGKLTGKLPGKPVYGPAYDFN